MVNTCFIEDMIQVANDEHKLFETMLAINFRKAEVLRESQLLTEEETGDANPASAENSEADDAVNQKFTDKIKEKWENILAFITKAFSKLMEVIKRVIYKDSTIAKKYREALTNAHQTGVLSGFAGIDNFKVPNTEYGFAENEINKLISDVENGKVPDDQIKADCDAVNNKLKEAFEGEPVKEWNKNGTTTFDFKKAADILASGKMVKPIYETVKKLGGNNIKAVSAKLNSQDNETAGKVLETAKNILAVTKEYFIALRRAFIICGTYAIKNAGKVDAAEAKKAPDEQFAGGDGADSSFESANTLAFAADLANEMYLDEQFAYI